MSVLNAAALETSPLLEIERMLAEQQRLTAVEQFTFWKEQGNASTPTQRYRDLMPLAAPRSGEQYAFEVDLDACTGCKACVAACHSLNGLREGETWRSVGLLHGGDAHLPVIQHVTSSCHHCLEPGCLQGCPVKAYEKDLQTGIVRHLDDQCIGCQYCIFKCPYDAPKYNRELGIVRKCDMCHSRLSVGEPPACVQACPNGAIRITVVDREDVARQSENNVFLPGAAEPEHTLPTTIYQSARPLPRNLLPADYYAARTEHAHTPLVVMLLLTQMSVGAFAADQAIFAWIARSQNQLLSSVQPAHAIAALLLGLLGMGASVLHLGRPLYAFRAILGLRTSWLSREIIAFGFFAAFASLYTASTWLQGSFLSISSEVRTGLGAAASAMGLFAVFCSAMVYVDTGRTFWRFPITTSKFFLTSCVLGLPVVLLISLAAAAWSPSLSAAEVMQHYGRSLCRGVMLAATSKLLLEGSVFLHLRDRRHTTLKRTALILTGPLEVNTLARFFVGAVGGVLLPAALVAENTLAAPRGYSPLFVGIITLLMLVLLMTGESLERRSFFAAVVAPRMPGVPAS